MRRLLIRRVGVGNRIIGNIMIIITTGNPMIEGVIKEENKFSFIWTLKVWFVFLFLNLWGWGL